MISPLTRLFLYRLLGSLIIAITVLLGIVIIVFALSGCVSQAKTKVITPPPAPTRTAQNKEDAKRVAGALTDSARNAHQRGLVAQSTSSGALVALAETNETYVGSPSVRVDPDNAKAIDALIGAMQRQETQYRADRAAWEQKIDALSCERDQYRTEVSTLGGAVAKLKTYLFWGAVLLGALCFLCPGLLWFIVRLIGGRARAHLAAVVKGVEDFRETNAEAAEKLKAHLSRRMDQRTKDEVLNIKDELHRRRRREAA